MRPQVKTFCTGAIGGLILRAYRDGELGNDEVLEVCRRMQFPPEFASNAFAPPLGGR